MIVYSIHHHYSSYIWPLLLMIKLSLKFLKNFQGRAFLIHFFIPILKQFGDRTSLLADFLIIEIQHWHDFVASYHEHLIRLLGLLYCYVPKRYFLENSLTHQLLHINQQLFYSCAFDNCFKTGSRELTTKNKGNIGHSCLQ